VTHALSLKPSSGFPSAYPNAENCAVIGRTRPILRLALFHKRRWC
jgi:hypothetical protein